MDVRDEAIVSPTRLVLLDVKQASLAPVLAPVLDHLQGLRFRLTP